MTCAEIKDRTIDYLYGELPEGERTAFDQHLAGCQSCRAEVGALQGTLQQARAAVKLTDEPPPARVRVAVMEAARAAVASAPLAARAAVPRPELKARAEKGGGFWAWLRGPWLMPLAGAAAAVAIFVMVRGVILKPGGLPEMQRSAEAPVQVSLPVAAPAPKMEEVPQAPPPANEAAPRVETKPASRPVATGLEGALGGRSEHRAAAANKGPRQPPADNRRYAPPPPSRRRALLDELTRDTEGLEGAAQGGAVVDGFDQKEKSQDKQEAFRRGAGAGSLSAAARADDAAGEKKQVRPSTSRELAKSAPAKPEAPTAASAPPPPRPVRVSPRSLESAAAPAPAAEPAPVAASAPAEAEADAPVARSKAKKDSLSPFDLQVQKADRLFTAGRWADAATAYRDLLRQYPQHQRVSVWKGRLRACEQALAQ
jgi:hypothetical protein